MNTKLIFGAAKEIITPAVRTTMIGFGTVFGVPFEDIHDDLYARTLLLEDMENGKQVILIAMDLLFHDDSLPIALRDYVQKTYGVDPNNLHVSYTHTHFGPAVKGYDFTWYKECYEEFLFDRICRSIDRAFLCRREGTMKFSAVDGDWNVSRRLMKDGVMEFLPNPDGERDVNLYLLKLEDASGVMRALLTSFACHPSNLRGINIISSEYPGRLCQRIEGEFYGCTALFFQGFGSDCKLKKGMKTSRFKMMSYEECDEVAGAMLGRVKTQLLSGAWQTLPVQLGSRVFQVKLPLEPYGRSYYEEMANLGNRSALPEEAQNPKNPGIKENTGLNSCRLVWACADYALANYENLPNPLPLNCGAVRINPDFYIFSMGGEPGVNIQTILRQHFADKQLLCFGYNDSIAYIPSDKMVAEGGYEASVDRSVNEYRLHGRILPGVDEIYRQGFAKALAEIEAE